MEEESMPQTRKVWMDLICTEAKHCKRAKDINNFEKYCLNKGKDCPYILTENNWREWRDEDEN